MDPLAQRRAEHVALLQEEVERLVQGLVALGAKKVYQFGSLTRRPPDLLTDVDLLAIMESDEPFVERLARIYQELGPRVAADILVYTPQEFEEMRDRPFLRHVLKTAVLRYAA
ncbi:MAG: nucleotidyltransferase domain-containing protein [candidate division NC10 bacterium]|nr:nucleotidyltransferase domain-containing protein [candidate division NC10 bacterium]